MYLFSSLYRLLCIVALMVFLDLTKMSRDFSLVLAKHVLSMSMVGYFIMPLWPKPDFFAKSWTMGRSMWYWGDHNLQLRVRIEHGLFVKGYTHTYICKKRQGNITLQPTDYLIGPVSSNPALCLSWPRATQSSGDGLDWHLGTPFLRTVYSIFR